MIFVLRKCEHGLQAVLPDSDDSGGSHVHGGAAIHQDHLIWRSLLLHHSSVHYRGHQINTESGNVDKVSGTHAQTLEIVTNG